jgi:hypothetical protein
MAREDSDVIDLVRAIRKDAVVSRALGVADSVDSVMDLGKVETECALLHKQRTSRELFKYDATAKVIYDASLRDLAARSRMSEIRARLYVNIRSLDVAYDSASTHASVRFGDVIKEYAANKADRQSVIDQALRRLVRTRNEAKSTDGLIEMYIKDIDSSGYALRNATELVKLIDDRRNA